MTLTLRFTSCLLCNADCATMRDKMNLDHPDENGARAGWWCGYVLPPARHRDRIAPDICDQCWQAHRVDVINRLARRRTDYYRPFRAIYFWAWVQERLEKEAESLGREARRLTAHLAEKAERGRGIILRGPRRDWQPQRVDYYDRHGL